jgi:hypothetical protein
MEKYTSIELMLETVVKVLEALTRVPTFKGSAPTTPAAGLFTKQ